jgi:excisionase family DNA binding protein
MMLRINDAALRLGVTPTTLRRWEAAGRIHAVRTAGGERRFDERELDRVGNERAGRGQGKQARETRTSDLPQLSDEPEYVTDDEPLPTPQAQSKPWDNAVQEARAGFQVRRIELERDELDRAALDAATRREQKARNDARALQEQQARAQAAERETQRLDGLRQHGDMLAALSGAPIEYRAAVTRDLVTYVTAGQFPASAWAQAYQYLKARVDHVLKPWYAEKAREQQRTERAEQEARDQRTCDSMIADGIAHAEREIAFWDGDAANEARRVIARELRDEVQPDWTPRDVAELVDEILDEWE